MSSLVYELSDFEILRNESNPLNIGQILSNVGVYYDLEVPYQRDYCWTQRMKVALIRSILAKIPIGPIHLVQKEPESPFYNVLDGKQRVSAIKSFAEGAFSITWKGTCYKFEDLKKAENKFLFDSFIEYSSQIVKWPFMSLLKQRTLFEVINSTASLNACEKIYCPYFFSRSLLKYIFNECFKPILGKVREEIQKDKRFGGVQWTHRVMLLCLGKDFNDSFAIRPINTNSLKSSARIIDDQLCAYFTELKSVETFKESLITPQVIEHLGLTGKINLIRQTVQSIVACLNYKNEWLRVIDSVTVMDLVAYILEKIVLKILTPAFIQEEKGKFHAFFVRYVDEKIANKNLARHTTDITSITERYGLFSKLFDELDIDKGQKNQPVPPMVRTLMLLDANPICPIEETYMDKNDVTIDHDDTKAIHSKTDYVVMSRRANCNLKNCSTKKKLLKMANLKELQPELYRSGKRKLPS